MGDKPKKKKEFSGSMTLSGSSRRKFSKDQISFPRDFAHVSHAGVKDVERILQNLDSLPPSIVTKFSEDYGTVRIKSDELSPLDEGRIPWMDPLSPLATKSEGDLSDIDVSEETEEKAVAAKRWMENYFDNVNRFQTERGKRRENLEKWLSKFDLTEEERENRRQSLLQKETDYTRLRRLKTSKERFQEVKMIGRGAFGVVKLVQDKETGTLCAMKMIKKSEVIKRKQEGHVKAERDLMSSAGHSPYIVNLFHSFQDNSYLYLVMEYMAGGDLLGLLIKKDIFPEEFAKFYMAEMVLAVASVHKMGYIHRDIKPDNFLLNEKGHIKVSDFGLCTGFHWAHDSKFYDTQRRIAFKKMQSKMSEFVWDETKNPNLFDENSEPKDNILIWREQNRRSKAFSVVGTNNYIAPEVLLQVGYNRECDWWSLGVILFEMLFGYPPFCSENRQTTKLRIVNWRKTLKIPKRPKVSAEARDIIEKLICDAQDRLGQNGADEIKNHPFFAEINWATIHDEPAPWIPELKSPTDTSCFEEVKPPEWALESDLDTGFDLYGFTYKGFYNLTRRNDEDNQFEGKKMDPLQAGVLRMLREDEMKEQGSTTADEAKKERKKKKKKSPNEKEKDREKKKDKDKKEKGRDSENQGSSSDDPFPEDDWTRERSISRASSF